MLLSSTGYGQHADYVFGWKGDSLQKAMDGGCFGATCSQLKTQAYNAANKCQVKSMVRESVDGCKCTFFDRAFELVKSAANAPAGLDKLPGTGE